MQVMNKCCFTFSLKVGTLILLVLYWWISVTYVVLLIQYFSEHTVPISILIGVIFIIWVLCASIALHGIINQKNAYYLIPQITIDVLDCILHLINLVYHLFSKKLLIPRYTIFGSNWTGIPEAEKDDGGILQIMYNLFDEKYPLPDVFAFIDLAVRLYFVLVFLSYVQEYRRRKLRRAAKKANYKSTKSPSPRSTSGSPQSRTSASSAF